MTKEYCKMNKGNIGLSVRHHLTDEEVKNILPELTNGELLNEEEE